MKAKVKYKVVVDIITISVDSYVRYWDDANVNGKPDDADVPQMPCAEKSDEGEYHWKPIIEIETGQILNWQKGVVAEVHYKACDEFACKIVGKIAGVTNYIKEYEGYVPGFMCPKEGPYGCYIVMDIDENGYIKDWDSSKVKKFVENLD